MEGILPLLFLCVTLHLADGNLYSHSRPLITQHPIQDDKSEAVFFREDPSASVKSNEVVNNGTKGPVAILGEAVMVTLGMLFEISNVSPAGAGQRRSDLTGMDFRDSSVSSRSGSTPRGVVYFRSDGTGTMHERLSPRHHANPEDCFVRDTLGTISSLVSSINDDIAESSETMPEGPELLRLFLKKINEHIESKSEEIKDLDVTFFQLYSLIADVLRGVVTDLQTSLNESSDDVALKFLQGIESSFSNYVKEGQANLDEGKDFSVIRQMLVQVEDSLGELSDGKPKDNSILSAIQNLIQELKVVVKDLFLGKNTKKFDNSLLLQVLNSTKSTLEKIIQEQTYFAKEKGPLNEFFYQVIIQTQERIDHFIRQISEK